ncbi:MAG: TonB C-terminal domain-containing protein [Raineya sp.]|jgi:TonB family protein|nr:TonB C-terminal domain-containing protein [Raineya sp.]
MKNIFLAIIFLLNWSFVWGQIVEKPELVIIEEKRIADTLAFYDCCCKQDACYNGGNNAFYKDLKSNLKYPKKIKKIKGEMVLTIMVSKQGKIINPKIERSLSKEYDRIVLKALKQTSQNWSPAKDDKGKNTNQEKRIQIIFNKRKFKII